MSTEDADILAYWQRLSHSELVELVQDRLGLPATRASPPEQLFTLLVEGEGPLTPAVELERRREDLYNYLQANKAYHALTCDTDCRTCSLAQATVCYRGGQDTIEIWLKKGPDPQRRPDAFIEDEARA